MANFECSIDTAANWASATRVPLLGEFLLASDTLVLKIGDGVRTFANLPAVGGGSVLIAQKEFFSYSTGAQNIVQAGTTQDVISGSTGLTFTAPASGRVQVVLHTSVISVTATNGSTYTATFSVGSASAGTQYGNTHKTSTYVSSSGYTNGGGSGTGSVLITGLTPGSSYTVYPTVTGTTNISVSGCDVEVYSA